MELSRRIRFVILTGLILFFLLLVYWFREVLPIFILAVLLAYILTPAVVWMSSKRVLKRKLSRGISVIVIYVVLVTSISFGGAYFLINLSNELQTLIKDIPSYGEQFSQNWAPTISKWVQNVAEYMPKIERKDLQETEEEESQRPVEVQPYSPQQSELWYFLNNTRFEIKQDKSGFEVIPHRITSKQKETAMQEFDLAQVIDDFVSDIIENLREILLGVFNYGQIVVLGVVTSIFQALITLMIAAFIIIDHERIIRFFLELFPQRYRKRLDMFLARLNDGLSGVVRGQLIICLVNGILTGIGLIILDVKFALTLSMLATVSSLIPIFGVFISSVPIILMAITDSFLTALLALGWILIIHFIEGNILNPKIMGKSAEIHPVLVILALMAGESTYGIFGALIAVPIFSILQNTFYFIREIVFPPELNDVATEVDPIDYKMLEE